MCRALESRVIERMSSAIRIASSSLFFPLLAAAFSGLAACASESLDPSRSDGGKSDALGGDADSNDARADAASDGGTGDLGARDAENMDAEVDAGPPDLGIVRFDAGSFDAGEE